jgi:hypothetical protein
MGKTTTAKLTSEERCRKAFEKLFPLPEATWAPETRAMWLGWEACWRYCESRIAEYIAS